MKMIKLITNKNYSVASEGECTELYSLEDLRVYPGISDEEYEECKEIFYVRDNIPGFIKQRGFSESKIIFIQVYDDEIEYVEDKVEELECQHIYRYLKTDSYGNDIFYCEKCLEYKNKTHYN